MNIGKSESIAAVICAAGESKRMGGIKKEYQKIMPSDPNSVTVLGHCARKFSMINGIKLIVIAHPKNGEEEARAALFSGGILLGFSNSKIIFTEGGKTRRQSVYNALRALSMYEPGFALIHDGARPWVSESLINSVIEAVKKHGAAIPLLPLTDTPKEHKNGFITRHLKRADTGCAQTPQGFKFPEILNAHEKAALVNAEFTDDAEIWGKFEGDVAVVPGEPENKKITFKEDL